MLTVEECNDKNSLQALNVKKNKSIKKISYSGNEAYRFRYGKDISKLEINNHFNLLDSLRKLDIKVPKIYHQSLNEKLLIFEDCGEPLSKKLELISIKKLIDITKILNNVNKEKVRNYVPVLDYIEILACLSYSNNVLGVTPTKNMISDMLELSIDISKMKRCFLHGDLHLDNLTEKNSSIYFIDFGLSRIGPYLYDVISLLNDPRFDIELVERLKIIEEVYNSNLKLDYKKIEVFRNYFVLASYKELYLNRIDLKYRNYYNKLLQYMHRNYKDDPDIKSEVLKGVFDLCWI